MPTNPFVAIGDIHGRDDLLEQLLELIKTESPGIPLVFVGDYIDRGPDSRNVLKRLKKMDDANPSEVICLKGNHEAMCLEFMDTPKEAGRRWLANGGNRTLESFDVAVPSDPLDPDELLAARDALLSIAGQDFINWIRSLSPCWQSGNVVVTHAGGDPSRPIEPRRDHGLLWGHPAFFKEPRKDGLWVVHGHFIVEDAKAEDGRIAIDTGAYTTGRLTAAVVMPDEIRFLST